jgi:hypothetical protein
VPGERDSYAVLWDRDADHSAVAGTDIECRDIDPTLVILHLSQHRSTAMHKET